MGGSSLGGVLLKSHTGCYLICILYPGASWGGSRPDSGRLGPPPEIVCGDQGETIALSSRTKWRKTFRVKTTRQEVTPKRGITHWKVDTNLFFYICLISDVSAKASISHNSGLNRSFFTAGFIRAFGALKRTVDLQNGAVGPHKWFFKEDGTRIYKTPCASQASGTCLYKKW